MKLIVYITALALGGVAALAAPAYAADTTEKANLDAPIKAIEAEVAKLKQTMDALAKERDRLRIDLGIIDLHPESLDPADNAEPENTVITTLQAKIKATATMLPVERAKNEQVSKMSDEQLIASLPALGITDPALEKQKASGKPTTEQVAALRKSLTENLATAEAALEKLKKQLEDAENKQANDRIRNQPYFEKKAESLHARRIYHAALNDLEIQRVRLAALQSAETPKPTPTAASLGDEEKALLVSAYGHLSKEDLDKAMADFNTVIDMMKAQNTAAFLTVGAHGGRAAVHLKKGNLDAAIADYTIAIENDPKPHYNAVNYAAGRAYAYEKKGDPEAAKADREKAAELKAKTPDPAE